MKKTAIIHWTIKSWPTRSKTAAHYKDLKRSSSNSYFAIPYCATSQMSLSPLAKWRGLLMITRLSFKVSFKYTIFVRFTTPILYLEHTTLVTIINKNVIEFLGTCSKRKSQKTRNKRYEKNWRSLQVKTKFALCV